MRPHGISSPPADVVLTVSELARRVRRALEREWGGIWVEGELSNLKRAGSGHFYWTIKDEGAAIDGVMWRSDARRLGFEPADGTKVRVFGGLTFYEPRGRFQLAARKMEPVGVGELELAFRRTWERLRREGLFDDTLKRPLPRHPRTVGIVTSPTGAAVRDLLDVLGRRAPHVRVVVRPARVQGEGAAEDVAAGLAELDAWGGCDVVIVGRGGGSLEDLWAFNEEILARAIRASSTPVICGVGHEVDRTIADFAADDRAPTPSAAAELAVPRADELRAAVAALGARVAGAAVRGLRERRRRVILAAGSPALRGPLATVRRRAQEVDGLRERLEGAAVRGLARRRLELAAAGGRLDALSPLAILERGYAIARRPDGSVVRRAAEAAPGDGLEVLLGRGALDCTVDAIRETARSADETEGSP